MNIETCLNLLPLRLESQEQLQVVCHGNENLI